MKIIMNKQAYSDYVRCALRFYSRNLENPTFRCLADEKNWNACETVLNKYFSKNKEVLISVYQAYDTIGDNVYESANKYQIPQGNIWTMMKRLEEYVARERGLI